MRIGSSIGKISLLMFFLALAQRQGHGITYYVSTHGKDSNPGTAARPFRTITHAYGFAGPDVTILVSPGTYNDYTSGWGIHLAASGTASSPSVLRSRVPGAAVIDGHNASDRNVGLYIDGNYNVVDGFEIRNCPKGGIFLSGPGGNDNQVLNCNIHNNGNPAGTGTDGRDGIFSSPGTSGNVYAGNSIHHNGRSGSNLDHGLYLCGNDEMVFNNILFANAANGLQVAGYTTVNNMQICNNVFAYNGANGIILWQDLNGVDIQNNIMYKNGHSGIGSWDAHGSGVAVDHNLSFGNPSGDFNLTDGGADFSYSLGVGIHADPRLINEGSSRFDSHLRHGSPAIQAGANLSGSFTTDRAGKKRPSWGGWDLGPYVYKAAP